VSKKPVSKKSKSKPKRIVALSDFHSGHAVGMTPPEYWWPIPKVREGWRYKSCVVQRELWNWFEADIAEVRATKPVDICVLNGDLIDGRGERSGSTELVTTNRFHQGDMAVSIALQTMAETYVMTYGTGYHTGEEEDYEDYIRGKLQEHPTVKRAKIGSHEWFRVNGVVFDAKHHVGTSSIPHGQYTPIAKDKLWNNLWALHDEQPDADVLLRSHVHYHVYCGDESWLAMTTPALQAMGTKFGSRRCSRRVTIGYVVFDVDENGGVTWQPRIAKLKANRATVLSL
jgi:predicted MPP superfamily phosphohydrolase